MPGCATFTRAISPPRIAADVKAMGGVLSAEDLRDCQARIMPATEYAWRGRTLQLAGGLTAAPTMMRVLDQMAAVPLRRRAGRRLVSSRSPAR